MFVCLGLACLLLAPRHLLDTTLERLVGRRANVLISGDGSGSSLLDCHVVRVHVGTGPCVVHVWCEHGVT
jgi:hypothetical protein